MRNSTSVRALEILLVISGLFAAVGCEPERRAVPVSSHPEEFEGRVLRCPPTSGETESVLYAADWMTRKLHRHPDLADYAGFNTVSSCDEAAAFVDAYDGFSARYPDFESRAQAPWTDSRSIVFPRLKIMNGGPDILSDNTNLVNPNPIVYLEHAHWPLNGRLVTGYTQYCKRTAACTGTFIGRDYILTGAHCMQDTSPLAPGRPSLGTNEECVPSSSPGLPSNIPAVYHGYSSWVITFGNDASNTPFAIAAGAYQLAYPFFSSEDKKDADIALLRLVEPSFHGEFFLPADISKGGAAAIGKAHDPKNSYHISGYGLLPNGMVSGTVLYTGNGPTNPIEESA